MTFFKYEKIILNMKHGTQMSDYDYYVDNIKFKLLV